MARLTDHPRIIWLLAIPLIAYAAWNDLERGAWLHLVAGAVLLFSFSQPALSPRRQRLEYLAFALFQVSMAIAVRGIIEKGEGGTTPALVLWALGTVFVVVIHRRLQRHLRAEAARAAAAVASLEA